MRSRVGSPGTEKRIEETIGGIERLAEGLGAVGRGSGDEEGAAAEGRGGGGYLAEGSLAEEDAGGGGEFK